MKMNRRTILKSLGLLPAAGSVLAPGHAFARPAERITPVSIEPYLSPAALVAARNIHRTTLYQYKEASRLVTVPCVFLAQMFYNDGLPRGFVSESVVREWASMLNHLATEGWEASLAPAGAVQMVDAGGIEVDLTAATAKVGPHGRPIRETIAYNMVRKTDGARYQDGRAFEEAQRSGRKLIGPAAWEHLFGKPPTAQELRPRVAVFSFLHFRFTRAELDVSVPQEYQDAIYGPRGFNKRMGTKISVTEGEAGTLVEPTGWTWRA